MITRSDKINNRNSAKKALSELDKNTTFNVRVGHIIPTWVIPKNVIPKQEVISKFIKCNNSNKNNIEIL